MATEYYHYKLLWIQVMSRRRRVLQLVKFKFFSSLFILQSRLAEPQKRRKDCFFTMNRNKCFIHQTDEIDASFFQKWPLLLSSLFIYWSFADVVLIGTYHPSPTRPDNKARYKCRYWGEKEAHLQPAPRRHQEIMIENITARLVIWDSPGYEIVGIKSKHSHSYWIQMKFAVGHIAAEKIK